MFSHQTFGRCDPGVTANSPSAFKLLVTGGSDCHGLSKGKPLIGTVKLAYEHVEKLKQKVAERKLAATNGRS